jgi:hypothetical protein
MMRKNERNGLSQKLFSYRFMRFPGKYPGEMKAAVTVRFAEGAGMKKSAEIPRQERLMKHV